MVLFIQSSGKGKTAVTETRSDYLGLGVEVEACLQRDTRELSGGDASTLFYCGGGYTTVYICKNSSNCTL